MYCRNPKENHETNKKYHPAEKICRKISRLAYIGPGMFLLYWPQQYLTCVGLVPRTPTYLLLHTTAYTVGYQGARVMFKVNHMDGILRCINTLSFLLDGTQIPKNTSKINIGTHHEAFPEGMFREQAREIPIILLPYC